MASLQCAGAGALALWQRQHSSGKRCSIGRQYGRRCSIAVSIAQRGWCQRAGNPRSGAWRAMASDSQAEDEEQEDALLSDEEEETEEEDEEDNVDVDVLSNEEIDALMKEYGNVVRSDPEPRKSSAEDANADAEALSMATALATAANEVKAVDIKLFHVKPLIYWARYFLIASAFSMPQVNAIVGRIEDIAQEQYGKIPRPSGKPSGWTLMDFGDVVVHIFLPSQREFYNLEEFYANAPLVELPFVSESSSSSTARSDAEGESEEEMISLS
ncbi:protein Iojap, chloroplastic [Selaginella moellendorffii]|uniref:protein Iojap, chloroplastic n=1 Tax=Selaginella moellendorffii TaxID=88036 RepID=UPI000D1D12C0|nr:protein Iojap, chloroplastic [Selaginella moellendorffii]|eukprot:XP_024527588.1 protein Iojap, chloroplastic [Selaginella moellendorffii]